MLEQPGAARVWQLRGEVFREDFQHLVKELAPAEVSDTRATQVVRSAVSPPPNKAYLDSSFKLIRSLLSFHSRG